MQMFEGGEVEKGGEGKSVSTFSTITAAFQPLSLSTCIQNPHTVHYTFSYELYSKKLPFSAQPILHSSLCATTQS